MGLNWGLYCTAFQSSGSLYRTDLSASQCACVYETFVTLLPNRLYCCLWLLKMYVRHFLGRTASQLYESVRLGVVTHWNPVRSPLHISCQLRLGSALTTTKPPNTSLAAKSLLVDTLGLVSPRQCYKDLSL